jgi:hypothetical protein
MINAHTADLPKMHICELHEGVEHETQWLRSSPAQYAAPANRYAAQSFSSRQTNAQRLGKAVLNVEATA